MTKKPRKKEHGVQVQLVAQLATRLRRDVFFTAIPNGGLRNPLVAMQLKAEGVQPGVADLMFLDADNKVSFLEMKTEEKGSRQTDAQRGFEARCRRFGIRYAVARGVDEALEILDRWGLLQ